MPDHEELDRLKYELEKQKLAFEQERYRIEKGFFNRNFGVLITAMVSCATIVVSFAQLKTNADNTKNQQILEQIKNANELNFEVAKFLMEKRNEIATGDLAQAKYIRTVVISSFPAETATRIMSAMRDTLEGEVQSVWADGVAYSKSITTRVQAAPKPGAKNRSSLSVEVLANEFRELDNGEARKNLAALIGHAGEFGISQKNEMDIFLALVFYETHLLRIQTENFNYSAQRLRLVFPNRFPTVESAEEVAHDPKAIANRIYAGKFGNREPDDGYRFRSRGYFQWIGRENYRRLGTSLGMDLESDPDKLLDPEINARAAGLYFAEKAKGASQDGPLDLATATRRIRGGLVGLAEIKGLYDRIDKLTE